NPATGPWSHPNAGFSEGTDYYNTGKMGDHWGTGIPVPVTPELMERGQQRFNITCAMCHGATAAGNGITKQYGLATVVTLQNERTFRRFTNAGRRIFREQPIRRAVICPRSCSSDCARTLSCWRIREPASIQLFMALCVWIFLHSMRRLLLLDDCASRNRRGMERRGTAATREYRRLADCSGRSVRTDSSAASPSLLVDGYSARR